MLSRLLICVLFLIAPLANAFNFSDITDSLLGDNATGIEGQLKDAEFEFNVHSALLLNAKLREGTHIIVSRHRSSVLISGEAATQELKGKVLSIVLNEAHLKWKQGDVNHVEPSNAQVCGGKATKMAANDRRRFNLKTAEDCSTVNRFYNEVRVATPRSEIEQSDDDVRRATIINKLLHASIIQSADTIKIVVSGNHVYLLGDQLTPAAAEKAAEFVQSLPNIENVVPLFRF
ncbi:MAG: transport-associated protein [Piscirickettsiaceae bacterium]|nr:MAG: transport-associated protein [Piscirickettsiaceae bacterium]PCI70898.1 MAG: transport-associated protein [Piscirickettsiaceae bacterium]